MDAVLDFVKSNAVPIALGTGILLVALLIYAQRRYISWMLMGIDYSLPWIGRPSRQMRKKNNRPDPRNGWFPAENKVCGDHYKFYKTYAADNTFFVSCRDYLEKVEELDRRSMPWYLLLMIGFLIIAEAYGFSYVLTLWGFIQAAEKDVPYLAGSLALILAVVAVIATHLAGHEQYLNLMARRCRRSFLNDKGNLPVSLRRSGHSVRLGQNQHADDGELPSIQMLNRLKRPPSEISNAWTIPAIVYIIFIAVASTYIRVDSFNVSAIDEQTRREELSQVDSGSVKVGGNIPDKYASFNANATEKTSEDRKDADRNGAWWTFATMAVIFIAIQFVAIMLGKNYGFAGSESKKAWAATNGFTSEEEFDSYNAEKREVVTHTAQARLSDIQGRILTAVENDPSSGEQIQWAINAGARTFIQYVDAKEQEEIAKEQRKAARETAKHAALYAQSQQEVPYPQNQPLGQPGWGQSSPPNPSQEMPQPHYSPTDVS